MANINPLNKITAEKYYQLIKEKFNDQFDYSKSKYIDYDSKIEIGCKRHGFFWQKAKIHLRSKYGCPECGNRSKITKEKFIEAAIKIHGNNYDYDKVFFDPLVGKINDYVIINCKKHGDFKQSARCHLIGDICKKCCIDNSRKTTDEFINEVKLIHNNFYDYSKTNYIGCLDKIIITCPNHGDFELVADKHFRGKGCDTCHTLNKIDNKIKIFLDKANQVHNNKYTYDLTNYKNTTCKVNIVCPIHGLFKQNASDHLSGIGCEKCCFDNRRSNIDDLIKKFKIIHNNKYDYSKFKYKSSKEKIEIICPEHDNFLQRPDNHLKGFGCQQCSNFVSDMEKMWIKSLNIPTLDLQKYIYINKKRFKVDAYDIYTNTIYEFYGDYWHGNPANQDPNKINKYKGLTFGELYKKTIEREDILKYAGYKIISIWERDFNILMKSLKQKKE